MVVQATDLPNREMIGLSDPLLGPGGCGWMLGRNSLEKQRIYGKMEDGNGPYLCYIFINYKLYRHIYI